VELESVDCVPVSAGRPRRNRGGPLSPSIGADVVVGAEPLGVISAGVPSSEPEAARRILGRSGSLLLEEGLLDELLPVVVLSFELEVARRNLGLSGSLSLEELLLDDEPLDELLATLSSELEAARRSLGLLPSLPLDELLPDELLPDAELFEAVLEALPDEELPGEELVARGCDVSSVAREAAECSSGVPSFTNVTLTAW
jgi:hypothetical protein